MNAYYWMKGTFFMVIQNATEHQKSSLSGIWIKFNVFVYIKLQCKNRYFVSVFWLTPEIQVNSVLNLTIPLTSRMSVNSIRNWTLYIFCLYYAGMSSLLTTLTAGLWTWYFTSFNSQLQKKIGNNLFRDLSVISKSFGVFFLILCTRCTKSASW